MTMADNEPKSLGQWLAYIERQHPRSIELGLDRGADAPGCSRHHHHSPRRHGPPSCQARV